MKKVQLTRGEFALVDDEDFDYLNQWKWTLIIPRKIKYAHRKEKGRNVYMHRQILTARNREVHVDHIDGNGLNNQKNNLRLCSSSQNNINRGLNKNNSSGYKGVYFSNSKNCWITQLKVNRKKISRCSRTAKEAAIKYNELALQYFGKFAVLNNV